MTRKIIVRVLKVLVITVILVGIGTALYFKLIAPAQKEARRTELQAQLPTAAATELVKNKTSLDEKHQQNLGQLQRFLQTQDTPQYSASYTLCHASPLVGGIVTINYEYRCQISYVDVYETTLLEKTASIAQDDQSFVGTSFYTSTTVNMLFDTTEFSETSIGNNYIFITGITGPGSGTDAREFADEEVLTRGSYIDSDAYVGRQLVSEAGNRVLDAGKSYFIFSDHGEYFTRPIGCAAGSFLFCESPI